MRCPACGFENPPSMRFCGQCGAPLQAVPGPLEERRPVTVLFADVVGSTELSARDPERFREQMARFYTISREEVQRFGGTVEKFIGDAVMAVFGLPTIHEDDPARAVRAAVAIRARLTPDVQAGTLPQIRIGLNTGEVVADLKAADPGQFLVTGEAVSLAARIQQSARPGQIVVGRSTYAMTRGVIDYRELPPAVVRSFPAPMALYECLEVRPRVGGHRGVTGLDSPLVGRDAELSALREVLAQLAAGQGGIVSVLGEAGLGKSRLLAAARLGAGDGVLWLEGQAMTPGQTISYGPFLQIIKRAVGITQADSEAEGWTKLELHLRDLFGDEVGEVLPYLATLLALQVRRGYEPRVQFLDGDAMRRQILRGSRWYVGRLARQRPVVMVIDDLHLIDQSSEELLDHLLPLVEQVPLLVIAASRPDPEARAAAFWQSVSREHAGRYTEIGLSPLTEEAVLRLAGNVLGSGDLPEPVRRLVLGTAEGNPLFVEEIVRSLIDRGAVARDGTTGRWAAAGEIDHVTIPNTLRGVILTRIDRLEAGPKHVLKAASVIGRTFSSDTLAAAMDMGERLGPYLAELVRRELVTATPQGTDAAYSFKHALTQEAVYESMLFRQRREMHRRVAAAIERLFADRLDPSASVLAFHFARAEEWEQALRYLLMAGDQAGRIAADAEALSHYHEALMAYSRAFGDRWDPPQRAQLERKMGEALYRRGDHAQALQRLERALAYLGRSFPSSASGVRKEIFLEALQHAGRWVGTWGTPLRTTISPAAEETVRTYLAMGLIDFWMNQDRLVLEILRVLNVSARGRFALGTAYGSVGLGIIFDHLGWFRLAGPCHRRALAVADMGREPITQGLAMVGMGLHALLTGDLGRARSLYHGAAATYRAAGDLRGWATALTNYVWVLYTCGELSEGLLHCDELYRVGEDTDDRQVLAWALGMRGRGLLLRGDVEAAAASLASGADHFRQIPSHVWTVISLTSLALCSLRRRRPGEALALLEDAEELARRHRLLGYALTPMRLARAEASLMACEQATGGERSIWLAKSRQACVLALKYARFAEARPTAFRLKGTLEWLRGRRAAGVWWERSLKAATALGMRYDLALTYRETGRRLGDRDHEARAEELFRQMHAAPN